MLPESTAQVAIDRALPMAGARGGDASRCLLFVAADALRRAIPEVVGPRVSSARETAELRFHTEDGHPTRRIPVSTAFSATVNYLAGFRNPPR